MHRILGNCTISVNNIKNIQINIFRRIDIMLNTVTKTDMPSLLNFCVRAKLPPDSAKKAYIDKTEDIGH